MTSRLTALFIGIFDPAPNRVKKMTGVVLLHFSIFNTAPNRVGRLTFHLDPTLSDLLNIDVKQ